MCSNTSSSGGGGGVSGSGGSGGDGDYGSLILKKPKRQRVPKRGPGVAELEKILREQESINSLAKDNNDIEGFSSSRISPFSNSYQPQNRSDHNDHFGPPAPHMTMLYGNGGKSAVLGGGNGGHTGGSSMVLPEQGLFPAIWNSCCDQSSMYGESPKFSAAYPLSANGSDHMYHFPVMFQKNPCHYSSPSSMSLFPQSGPLSSSDNTAAGFYLHLEPPSNQRSHQNLASMLPADEEKACQMIFGMKQSRTFSVDNTSDPPFQFQVSPHFSQLNMPDKFPSRNNLAAFNLKQNETFSCSKPDVHFRISGSTPTPPHSQTSPFQETSERSNQASSRQGGTVQKKPFFSFLIPEEHTGEEAETALTLNNERGRMRGEAIDLNLKL